MMRRSLLLAGAGLLCLAAGTAGAQDKKTLAIVVKGLDNPFFEQINLGCQKWQAENPDSEYTCLYTGPASSADEAGEVQIVDDLLTKRRRGDRDLALQRAGDGQSDPPARAGQSR